MGSRSGSDANGPAGYHVPAYARTARVHHPERLNRDFWRNTWGQDTFSPPPIVLTGKVCILNFSGQSIEFLEFLPDGIIVVDRKGDIYYANSRLYEMFGYDPPELEGVSVHTLIPMAKRESHKEHVNRYMHKPRRMEMQHREDLEGLAKNGDKILVEITLAPLTYAGEHLVAAVVRDLSSRNYVQRLERKNKEIQEFTYITSHNLQEPLKNILSLSCFLEVRDFEGLDEDTVKCLGFINQSVKRMSTMVKALMDYSRIGQDTNREPVCLNELLSEVISGMQSQIERKEARVIVKDLPEVYGVRGELRMLFENLISNGIKFHREGDRPLVVIRSEESYSHHVILVSDNGIGISDKNSDAIFRIFQRLHSLDQYQEGAGIGLAHSRKIVENHNGTITV